MTRPESNPTYSFDTSTHDETTLIASPSYPNSICWSNENLLAVACGKLITILNPASLAGPRGLITLKQNKPFPMGVVKREELLSPCLMPICLSRNTDPCVRSISWSPSGFSPNGGCLLSVCTFDGHVKLYRSPYMEFACEWIEIADVSQLLYKYHASVNFAEADNSDLLIHQANEVEAEAGLVNGKNLPGKKDAKRLKSDEANSSSLPRITPQQYASRSAILSSLVVGWSPVLPCLKNLESPIKCSILAIGAKSGGVSFWRICVPEQYSVGIGNSSIKPELVGFLEAHVSWVSAIDWGLSVSSSHNSQLILVTGSFDGSVKLWSSELEEVTKITESKRYPFCLLMEIKINEPSPVATISLSMPENSENKVVLAIGRGSGSLDLWTYNLSCDQLISAGTYHSHNQMVMGLSFSFDGRCLYSCSQDNSVCSWVFDGSHLHEINITSDIPGNHNLANLSHLSDLCYGIAVSPGDMMVAVVCNLDPKLLNPMYQFGTQKAMVELLYTGGWNLEIIKEPLDSSGANLTFWESNILYSLKKFENCDKDLVIWDIITVLSGLKKANPGWVEKLLCKWFSGWFSDIQQDAQLENILSHTKLRVSTVDTRKLHLISVICRRITFVDSKSDNERQMWHEVLVACEKELRERLVGCTFALVLNLASGSSSEDIGTQPVGVGQMVHWLSVNNGEASDWLKNLLSKLNKLRIRIQSLCQYTAEETCSYCAAPVQFESPEIAGCNGGDLTGESTETHMLSRCAVSMQLCSIVDPIWFCICCQRSVDKLPPQGFFRISGTPLDVSCVNESLGTDVNVPWCPFCGIMLQRLLPDFLLSINPV
ncbi:Transducin/WD40 repeat-like superfamily protein [Rhynchospora pubera]|uniref:Transducin/WD40 repeat-like superfamily protein n=1 Tax=Rhynchospora pubera TaxID=906938 RepID=A0AAV8FD75_9POAL|nr:Transducin/WD40 repeat-like superfamily protein [Rhynchospora pubera]